MSCGQFAPNALFFGLGALACNLYSFFEKRAPPKGYRRSRAGAVRYRLNAVAGKVVRSAPRSITGHSKPTYTHPSRILGRSLLRASARFIMPLRGSGVTPRAQLEFHISSDMHSASGSLPQTSYLPAPKDTMSL
jgi:hypothetical protein